MFVLDVLFDHIQQIASNVEIIGRLVQFAQFRRLMSELGVRRDKAALSSGCKAHPANAPAGSNRSSYGGNEVAEAFG